MTSEELYNRLFTFAAKNLQLVKILPNNLYNREYIDQLLRSSASPGANYIEALEASSRKDFIYRLKVCRKETRESAHWLNLLLVANKDIASINPQIDSLLEETEALKRIFTASILSAEKKQTS